MKQDDKELLVIDLSARLPYGVKVQCESDGGILVPVYDMTLDTELLCGFIDETESLRPYLRPMSSMTDEEWHEFNEFYDFRIEDRKIYITISKYVDWLNRKMFDYRGLIPKGLAIEVTKDNNPYKE